MRREKTVIMQCCICGREKTDQGWEYQARPEDAELPRSHGFCAPCYQNEILKVQMQMAVTVAPSCADGRLVPA